MKELIEKWGEYKEWIKQDNKRLFHEYGEAAYSVVIANKPSFEGFMDWLLEKAKVDNHVPPGSADGGGGWPGIRTHDFKIIGEIDINGGMGIRTEEKSRYIKENKVSKVIKV